uniref:Uncharacterized protein n=1 Tax=Anguilla anguilla TaxID=7936 RepID=A0A0E9VKY8_ANGAN
MNSSNVRLFCILGETFTVVYTLKKKVGSHLTYVKIMSANLMGYWLLLELVVPISE